MTGLLSLVCVLLLSLALWALILSPLVLTGVI